MSPSSEQLAGGDAEWVIEPRARRLSSQLREVWVYRRLFRYFGKRVVERRYQGTLLGAVWLFRPVFPLIIRVLVFGGILGVNAPGVPYFLFVLVGSSIWELFAGCLMWSMRSLQMNKGSIGSLYFPRIIVPAASTALAFINFAIMLGITACVLGYYYFVKGQWYLAGPENLAWALGAVVLAALLGLAVGLWAAPLNAEYRDVRFTLMYILEFWALLTPILYPLSRIPERYSWAVFLNPLAGVVQAFKWGVLGVEDINVTAFGVDIALTVLLLGSGIWYFNRIEGQAMDRI